MNTEKQEESENNKDKIHIKEASSKNEDNSSLINIASAVSAFQTVVNLNTKDIRNTLTVQQSKNFKTQIIK